MRIATWNVNSLRARLERVEGWLTEVDPDVALLQETKLADDAFPALTFEALGYQSAHHGQGQWNGVAILSKVGIDDVVAGFADGGPPDPDARLVTATCGGLRVSSAYVPNGRSLDDDHYAYKLDWMDRLAVHVRAQQESHDSIVVGGDYNIAPDDRDVHDPAKYVGATHVSEAERERLDALVEFGLIDVFRHFHDDDRVFSWWDYRGGDFHQGRGMRIDLLMCSTPVVERSRWCLIDRNARKGKQPSDHAPVIVELGD